MAKKQTKKAKTSSAKKHKGRPKKGGWKPQISMVLSLTAAVIFLPSSAILAVGMLPTVVAALFVDRTKKKTMTMTIGTLNFAGCTPFLLKLWVVGHTFDNAIMIISDPYAIIIMYAAAGVGYLINWAMTDIVAKVLYQRGAVRQDAIVRRQEELVERWGKGVTGTEPLDEHGFPLSPPASPVRDNSAEEKNN